jgi:membrane-bound ClpP family serine protease
VLKAFRLPPLAGAEKLVNHTGIALTDLTPGGQVRVDLEEWSAISSKGNITAGQQIVVVGVSGVRLQVAPAAADATVSDTGGEHNLNGHSQNGE